MRRRLAIGLGWWAWFETQPSIRWVILVLLAAQFATAFQVVEFWFQVQYKAAALVPWRTGATVIAALLKMGVAVATQDPVLVAGIFAVEYLLLGAASLVGLRRAGGFWMRPGPSPNGWAGSHGDRRGCSHRAWRRSYTSGSISCCWSVCGA